MSEAADITGFVEATTATRVLGWAWAPRAPTRRVTVQALLGDSIIAEAEADRAREDLARNGIGDGRHAFELKLPETARTRLGELQVVVRTGDGVSVPLRAPPAAGGAAEPDRLQRSVDAMIASQRVLHRNLQAALVAPRTGNEGSELAALAETLSKQMATLELFVMRLEEKLTAGQAVAATPAPRATRANLAAFAMASLALAVAIWGVWRQLP